MDEHRHREVALREHHGDVRQVGSDRRYGLGILAVVGGYFDGSAVRVQTKMVSCLVMRKTHRLITMFLYVSLMLRRVLHVFFGHRAGLHILRRYLQRAGQKKRYCDFHDF